MELPSGAFYRQRFPDDGLIDAGQSTTQLLQSDRCSGFAVSGRQIGIAVGSRGIDRLADVVASVVSWVHARGGHCVIVPAMGSHAGAAEDGQTSMVRSLLGIESHPVLRDVEIDGSMATDRVGLFREVPLHVSHTARMCDALVIINRVKPHTRLVGSVQSGLIKMCLVGLGKHVGAANHHRGFRQHGYDMDPVVQQAWPMVRSALPPTLGIALLENESKRLFRIEAIAANRFASEEPTLLNLAYRRMARLPVEDLDLLIVDRIGKDISGTGMDAVVIGRKRNDLAAIDGDRPNVREIYVRDLSDKTAGNATGIGMAHYCHKRLVDRIDEQTTNLNCLTAGHASAAAVPMAFESDRDAMRAIRGQSAADKTATLRWMRIRDTGTLQTVWASDALATELSAAGNFDGVRKSAPLEFDTNGNFESFG